MNLTDPNLTEVVTYLHSENIIATKRNADYDSTSCTNGCIAFQAGPLIASEGILIGDYGNSWHANEKHERTILGVFHSYTPIIFVFTEKVTLAEA